jgi:type VI protein secretion system component VasA
MLLVNCLPIANLFSKKSDPIKLDLTQEEYELFADADRELYRIYSIENLYIYEPSEKSVLLEPNREYFVRREGERVFISIKSKFELKNPEKKIIYADLNCSNAHVVDEIKIGDSLSVDRIPWLKARILTKPTKSFFLRKTDKWPFLALFTQNFFSRNDANLANILSDMCNLYDLELHGILEVSRKHAYGIRKTDFMWRGVFPKEAFEIKIATDSEFIVALLLARVLINCASIGSFAEVKILSADGNTLKLIEEENEA